MSTVCGIVNEEAEWNARNQDEIIDSLPSTN